MKNLAQAKLKVQQSMKAMEKNAENPFFNSSYLSLETIQKELLPMLNDAGLVVTQHVGALWYGEHDEHMSRGLITEVVHAESGEKKEYVMPMPEENNPQKLGSLITYFKRYQLQAIFFVPAVGEDDDGNSASGNKSKSPETFSTQPVSKRPSL